MARQDIMPHSNATGGHCRVTRQYLTASETFLQGEPVRVTADGLVKEPATDPDDNNIYGIAAVDGNGGSAGDDVQVYVPNSDQYWLTKNYSEAGSAFADTAPVAARIGDEIALVLISGSWGVSIVGNNNIARIVDVLDAQGESVRVSSATGTQIVFVITHHQNAQIGATDAPAAA